MVLIETSLLISAALSVGHAPAGDHLELGTCLCRSRVTSSVSVGEARTACSQETGENGQRQCTQMPDSALQELGIMWNVLFMSCVLMCEVMGLTVLSHCGHMRVCSPLQHAHGSPGYLYAASQRSQAAAHSRGIACFA